MVALRVILNDFHGFQLLQAGFFGYFVFAFIGIMFKMADIRNVADIAHFVAQVLEKAEEHIVRYAWTGMAKMGVSINSGAADIHAYVSLMNRFKQFLVTGECIGKV